MNTINIHNKYTSINCWYYCRHHVLFEYEYDITLRHKIWKAIITRVVHGYIFYYLFNGNILLNLTNLKRISLSLFIKS